LSKLNFCQTVGGLCVDINKDYKYDVESILYVFANKFLSGKDLERVKEIIGG
jgi:hypothetical protein